MAFDVYLSLEGVYIKHYDKGGLSMQIESAYYYNRDATDSFKFALNLTGFGIVRKLIWIIET